MRESRRDFQATAAAAFVQGRKAVVDGEAQKELAQDGKFSFAVLFPGSGR